MNNNKNAIPLILSFLTFSMLLNCMGVVILQLSHESNSFKGLGILEFFKDIPVALISVFATHYIHRFGYRTSLLFALIISGISCLWLPLVSNHWFFKIWFMLIGISFAITKISVFSILKITFSSVKEFSKAMNRIEASFMIGIFLVNIGFALILNSKFVDYWKFGFWGIAIMILFTIISVKNLSVDYKPSKEDKTFSFLGLTQFITQSNFFFFGIIFLIVFLEQGLNSWLPTFYKNQLKANSFYALNSSAFFALFSFIGRYTTSNFITKISIKKYFFFCLFSAFIILIFVQIMFTHFQEYIIILIYIFPFLGVFVAPLYPLINSQILSITDKNQVAKLVSFIVLFSSLGGSFGSLYIAMIFDGNVQKYYALFLIIPIILLLLMSILLFKNKMIRKNL